MTTREAKRQETEIRLSSNSKALKMTIKSSLVMVYVSDMDRAIDFYTNKLGFPQKVRYGNEWAEVQAPGLVIALHPLRDQKIAFSHNMQIGFDVEDIQKAIEEFKGKGIDIKLWGGDVVNLAPFTDDDGNQMYLHSTK
jgi:catechol 2,3-dioxygenase-like lactoylglutathione lyase family enzyme